MKVILSVILIALATMGASKCEDGDGGDVDVDSDSDGDTDSDGDSDSETDEDTDPYPNCPGVCSYGGGCSDGLVHCDGTSCPSLAGMFGTCCQDPWEC